MAKIIEIEGHGGGKSGGASSGPNEAPNTLQSKANAKFVDLLLEGPIKGFPDANPRKNIILNKVAVLNPDGTENHKGVKFAFLPGTSDQPSLPGYDGITAEFDVGRRVRADTPVVYATNGSKLTAIVVTVSIPSLTKQDKKTGDLNGFQVAISIDVRNSSNANNQYVTVFDNDIISGKNVNTYERSYRIALNGAGPWQIRMRRNSADTDDVTIQDKTFFGHVTEIIEHKIAYSDSAVIGMEIDAEQFGTSIPDRAYDLLLQEIEYPSNYNPLTRVYTGFWDGTFAHGWCNNPAWVFRTLAAHSRFGADIDPALIDKWGLYELAKFCDESVPDGFGGTEPRFAFNGVMRTRQEAYKVLQSIASMMRAIVFYGAGAVLIRQDRPMQPEHNIYTPANVKGDFNYGGTALKVRHNAAIVQWINPALGYDTDYTSYEHLDAIIKFGYNPLNIQAIGTTSEGQAFRQGKWAILTEQYQTETVSFTTGYDSADVLPGDVIEIADPHFATADFGGRVLPNTYRNQFGNTKMNAWLLQGVSLGARTMAGPWGAKNLAEVVLTAGSNSHMIYRDCTGLVTGQSYTASIYIRPNGLRFFRIRTERNGIVNFDIVTGKVRATNPLIDNFWVEDHGDGLFRVCVTFKAQSNVNSWFALTFDNPVLATGASYIADANLVGVSFFAGAPQVEPGTDATIPYPYVDPSVRASTFMLDRPLEFTGTAPSLHLTLVDGTYDDIAGVDNTARPARRKVNYFSSNVAGWDEETSLITLSTATPANSTGMTPMMWIFSKDELKPRKWKVVSIKETDKKDYQLVCVNYSAEKFAQLDENYIIREQDGPFTNLPDTSFCYPPTNLIAVYSTQLVGGLLSANINVGWTPSDDKLLRGYVVAYRRDADNWTTMPLTAETNIDIMGVPAGSYQIIVKAVSKFGTASAQIQTVVNVMAVSATGKTLVYNVVTDRGDQTFTDRDIKLFWSSNALSQDLGLARISGRVVRPGAPMNSVPFVIDQANKTAHMNDSMQPNDDITVVIGSSEFTVVRTASETTTQLAARMAALINADTRFISANTGFGVNITPEAGATNASEIEAQADPLFKAFRVVVKHPTTNVVLMTDYCTAPEFRYSYANNLANSTTPLRSVKFEISVLDINNNLSTPAIVTITNPAPALVAVNAVATFGQVNFTYDPPIDPDFAGIIVYASQTAGFTPAVANRVWMDRGQPVINAIPGSTLYYRYGFYDLFGTTGITLSAQFSIAVPAVIATDLDTTPPATPTGGAMVDATSISPLSGQPVTAITFTWNAVGDSDLDSYEIQYKEASGAYIGGFYVAKDYTSHTYAPVKANTLYTGQVRAVDKFGNKSNWSTAATRTTTKDNVAPAVPTGISAEAAFNSVFLRWTNANGTTDQDLAQVEVWEGATNNSAAATRIATVNALPGVAGGFTRTGLAAGLTRYYWLKSVDTSKNTSGFTAASVVVTATQITATDFGNGIAPYGRVTSLPNPVGYTGVPVVYNSTDAKLYRYIAGAWTVAVDGGDITQNTITANQIKAGTITTAELSANAIEAVNIRAGAIITEKMTVGTINGDRLTFNTINADKIMSNSSLPATLTIGTTGFNLATVQSAAANSGNVVLYEAGGNVNDQFAIEGNKVTKLQPVNVWSYNVYSRDGYTGGAVLSAMFGTHSTMFGLTDGREKGDGTTADWNTIDYTWHSSSDGNWYIMESGNSPWSGNNFGGVTFTSKTNFSIAYDGVNIKYYADAVLVRTTPDTTAGRRFYAAVAASSVGYNVYGINFTSYVDNSKAVAALASITSILADNVISRAEKLSLISQYNAANAMAGEANAASAALVNYSYGDVTLTQRQNSDAAVTALVNYLSGLSPAWDNVAVDTPVDGPTLRARFNDVYDKVRILNVATQSFTQNYAGDPATRINAFTTKVNPGSILISGATTLANWRNGTDLTKIEGGSIAANTILANLVTIGLRGINVAGLEFTANWNGTSFQFNRIYWSAGSISYVNDAGTSTTAAIDAGFFDYNNGTIYIYWVKGATTLSVAGAVGTGNLANNITMATYRGAANLVVTYGRTIIDGSKITAATITGDRITALTITADQIAGDTITGNKIKANTITATNILVSNLSSLNANLGAITAGTISSANGNTFLDFTNNSFNFDASVFKITIPGVITSTPFALVNGELTLTNVTLDGVKVKPGTLPTTAIATNAVTVHAYFNVDSGGSLGSYTTGVWRDFDTTTSGGSSGGVGGGGGGGGGGVKQQQL